MTAIEPSHNTPRPSRMREGLARVRALGALGPLAVFTAVGPLCGAFALAATAPRWFPALEELGDGSLLVVVGATVALAGLSLVPTHATSLVAGLLFGGWRGTATALVGILGAAALAYTLTRLWLGARRAGPPEFAPGSRARAVHDELLGSGALRAAVVIALVRLSPIMPFAATNLVMSVSGVGSRAFLGGTLVGIAPRVAAVAVSGASLNELDLDQPADARLVTLSIAGTLLALVVVTALARRALTRMTPVIEAAAIDPSRVVRREE